MTQPQKSTECHFHKCQIQREGTQTSPLNGRSTKPSVREEHRGWELIVEYIFRMYSKYISTTLPCYSIAACFSAGSEILCVEQSGFSHPQLCALVWLLCISPALGLESERMEAYEQSFNTNKSFEIQDVIWAFLPKVLNFQKCEFLDKLFSWLQLSTPCEQLVSWDWIFSNPQLGMSCYAIYWLLPLAWIAIVSIRFFCSKIAHPSESPSSNCSTTVPSNQAQKSCQPDLQPPDQIYFRMPPLLQQHLKSTSSLLFLGVISQSPTKDLPSTVPIFREPPARLFPLYHISYTLAVVFNLLSGFQHSPKVVLNVSSTQLYILMPTAPFKQVQSLPLSLGRMITFCPAS